MFYLYLNDMLRKQICNIYESASEFIAISGMTGAAVLRYKRARAAFCTSCVSGS